MKAGLFLQGQQQTAWDSLPDEGGLVRVIEGHEQLGVFPNVADKVLEVHIEAVGVDGTEDRLAPQVQVLKN